MKLDEFYKKYEKHITEKPVKKALKYDGYELHFLNGDNYIHTEELKPNRKPSSYSGSYMSDDFIYKNYWNGELISC